MPDLYEDTRGVLCELPISYADDLKVWAIRQRLSQRDLVRRILIEAIDAARAGEQARPLLTGPSSPFGE
jgi:hypothetical protein